MKTISLLVAALLSAQAIAQDAFAELAGFKYGDEAAANALFQQVYSAKEAERASLEEGLIGVISSSAATPEGKAFACRMLRLVATDKCVPVLAPLLLEEQLSHPARLVLEPIKSAASRKALRDALGEAKPNLQPGILGSLAACKDSEALPQIAQLASGSDAQVAAAAIRALGKIGGEKAASALLGITPSQGERNYLHALIDCLPSVEGEQTKALSAKILASNDALGQAAALPMLAKADPDRAALLTWQWLKGTNASLREGALSLLALRETHGKVIEAVASKLPELEPAARAAALVALGAGGNPKALTAVKAHLKDPAPEVLAAALDAASKLGDEETVGMLLAINAPKALDALSAMTGTQVDSRLIDALEDKSLRASAAEVLSMRRSHASVPPFIAMLSQDDPEARNLAWRALGEIAPADRISQIWQASQAVKESKEKQLAASTLKAICAKAPDRKAVFETVATFYGQAPDEVKGTILELASISGSPAALKVADDALNSGNPTLRSKAIRALAAWANVSAAPALLELHENGATNSERILALRGYIGLAGKEPSSKRAAAADDSELTAEKQSQMFDTAARLAARNEEKLLLLASMKSAHSDKVLVTLKPFMADENLRKEAEIAAVEIVERNRRSKNPVVLEMAELLTKSQNEAVSKRATWMIEDIKKK